MFSVWKNVLLTNSVWNGLNQIMEKFYQLENIANLTKAKL